MLKRFQRNLHGSRIAGLAVIFLAYSIGVFRESFWSDDYPALLGTRAMATHLLGDARPTSAGLLSLSFSILHSPANAWVLRLLALIGTVLIFDFVSRLIADTRYRDLGNLSVAIGLCLPSLQMYIHWSTAWYYPWAALAGLYALRLWQATAKFKKVSAVILLALAITTYPPAAVFFFAVLAVDSILYEATSSTFVKDGVKALSLFISSTVLSSLLVLISFRLAGVSSSDRVSIVGLSAIPHKLVWLVTRPIVIGFRPFAIDSPSPKMALLTALPALVIFLLGVHRQARKLGENFLLRAFAISSVLLLTLIPIAVAADNQIEFRILPGFSWGIAAASFFFFMLEIEAWLSALRTREGLRKAILLFCGVLISFIAIVSVNSHYEVLIGKPYREKTAFLNTWVAQCLKDPRTTEILVVAPEKPFPVFKRLGVFSMSTDLASAWVPEPNVTMLVNQFHSHIPVAYLDPRPAHLVVNSGQCRIDLEVFRKSIS